MVWGCFSTSSDLFKIEGIMIAHKIRATPSFFSLTGMQYSKGISFLQKCTPWNINSHGLVSPDPRASTLLKQFNIILAELLFLNRTSV